MVFLIFVIAILAFTSKAAKPSKNREVFQAKTLIDSLLLKLHLNLKQLQVKEQAAENTAKETRNEISVLRLEQGQASKIQRLLHKLATGQNAQIYPVCPWHGYNTIEFQDMQPIVIRSISAIPKEYTISFDGNVFLVIKSSFFKKFVSLCSFSLVHLIRIVGPRIEPEPSAR